MNNLKTINYHSIYIFDENRNSKTSNSLKEFIYYLKFKGQNGVIDFTYSCDNDSLHQGLTIKENFILDAIPTSLIKDGENNLNEFLSKLKNPFLAELIETLGPLNQKINSLDKSTLKLTSIIKSLLSQSEYVFLVTPESDQNFKAIKTLKKCIEFEVDNNLRKFFIKPRNKDSWMDISTHIITKCEKSHGYNDTPNPLKKLDTSKSFKPTYDFKLLKKAS
jgi:hypothetical protein